MKKHGRRYLVSGEVFVPDKDFELVNSIDLRKVIKNALKEYINENNDLWDVRFDVDVTFLERY